MTRRPASPHRSSRLLALAPATVLALVALTACTEGTETDTRPVSSADEFFEVVESLDAVEGIDRIAVDADDVDPAPTYPQPSCGPDDPTPEPAAPPRTVVHLDDEADSVALRVAERAILNLYSDHRYPDGPPQMTMVSGRFRVDAPRFDGYSRAAAGSGDGTAALNLPQLPHLADLPDVEGGALEDTQATARLSPGTDLRDWLLENTDAPGSVRLDVTASAATGSSSCSDDSDDAAALDSTASAEPSTTRFSFSLGSDTAPEAVRTLFETADAGGATVLAGSVDDRTQQRTEQGDLQVPSVDDVSALHDALVTQYGAAAQDGFSVRTDDGLTIELGDGADSLDDVLAAHTRLTDAGASVRRIEMNNGGVAVTIDDSDGLQEVVDLVSDADWPLGPDEPVEVSHRDLHHYGADFEAQAWPAHRQTIAALWDAGFTAVLTGSGSRGAGFGLSIGDAAGPDVSQPAGRDALVTALRNGDWPGRASIAVEHDGDRVSFTSTATGTADRTDDSRYGEDQPQPPWARELLATWDATTG